MLIQKVQYNKMCKQLHTVEQMNRKSYLYTNKKFRVKKSSPFPNIYKVVILCTNKNLESKIVQYKKTMDK